MTKRVEMKLQRNIAVALAKRGWSQARAAREMGMNRASFGDRVRGHRPFRLNELVQLAGILDVDVEELLEGIQDTTEYQDANQRGRRLRALEEAGDE